MMKRMKVTVLAMALIFGLSALTGCASRDQKPEHYTETTTSDMVADVAAVRPMTLVASGVGLVAWIFALPFTIPAGNYDQLGQAIVADPLEYTFMRPVGNFSVEAKPVYKKPIYPTTNP